MLQGFQFDKMQAYPTTDASLFSYLAGDRSFIIPNRGNELNVTTSELNITVDTGEALILGRQIKITEPMVLTIGANQSGYLVIEIDLSKANTSTGTPGQPDYEPINNQLSLKFVNNLTQDNINNGGLIYQFNLGSVSSTSNSITFVKNLETSFMYQPTLFEGSVATGNIVLNENMYNYRFLVFYIKDTRYPQNSGFGYGLFPVIQSENREFEKQPVFIGNTGEVNNHSTYAGLLSFINDTTLNLDVQFSNVTHTSGSNHGGALKYNVTRIIGIR